jgi:hypothetical protein
MTVKYLRENPRTGSFEYRRRVPEALKKLVSKREFLKVLGRNQSEAVMHWTCPAYVPVSELIYAAFRSNAKGLLPPSDE